MKRHAGKIVVNQRCKEIYEEIESSRRLLKWTHKEMCEKCYYLASSEDDAIDGDTDKKNLETFYQKYKKILARKSWEKDNATEQTLINLERMRELIYQTDEYQKIDGPMLTVNEREQIKNASDYLDKALLMRDSEK